MRRAVLAAVGLAMAIAGISAAGMSESAVAQDACRAPAPAVSTSPNIFTPAQESDLGDAVIERLQPSLRAIEDDAVNAHLRRIGAALVSHLPQNGLRISFTLVDLPEANAFVLPGGRVFVTRKLVGFTQNEDELASVLGHELGHLVARQQSIQMTKQFADVIGATDVGDRDDIFEKYNRMMDNAARKPGAFKTASHTDKDQIEADRLGVFVVAAAGYDPQAHVRLFDRFAGTEGNTGSFLSTLFGVTSPDAKRLGEMIKTTAKLPADCAAASGHDQAAYEAWQRQVLTFTGLGRTESLAGVVMRKPLSPPLRGEVSRLRFSPDGRLVLAQDDAGIVVLRREPLSSLFRIDAADVESAHFTPDSSAVVFHTSDLRVERWSVASHAMEDLHDIVRRQGCLASALSPDGLALACVDSSFTLWIIDVPTGQVTYQKKSLASLGLSLVADLPLAFSPDGQYVIAGHRSFAIMGGADEGAFVYDLTAKKPVNLNSQIQRLLSSSYAFLAPDRVIGLDALEPAKSAIFSFPAGKILERIALARATIEAPSRGNFVLLRPFQKYAVAVLNLETKVVVKGNPLPAFDMYDDAFAAERGTGDIGLYKVDGNAVIGSVTLPDSELGTLRAAAVSPDLKWLAVSESSRGGIWDLQSGTKPMQIRGFRGAAFDDRGVLAADMPQTATEPRAIMRVDPVSRQVGNAGEIKDRIAVQFGKYLLIERPLGNASADGAEFELRDVTRSMRLWTRSFPKDAPQIVADPTGDSVILVWPATSTPARDRFREDERLRAQSQAVDHDLEGDYVVDVMDAERGIVRARLYVETGKGSFGIRNISASGAWAAVSDSLGRVLMYSLETGELNGYAFGTRPVMNVATKQLAVNVGGGHLAVYDLETMRRRRDYEFTHPVVFAAFSGDGSRLFALSANQVAYVLDLAARP